MGWLVVVLAGSVGFAGLVAALRGRPAARGLAVLGAAIAGGCAGLTSLISSYDRRGWSASPSGYGATFAGFASEVLRVVGPLTALGLALGAWAGWRWSRAPARVAIASAAVMALSLGALALVFGGG